jgi:hypothetical protein
MKWLGNKSTQAAFTRSPGLKVTLLILALVLLLASAFGVWMAYTMPEEREEPVTLVNYEHQGEFDYLVYVEPGHLFGPPPTQVGEVEEEEEKPLYFTNIIDDIEVSFTYGFDPDYPYPFRLTSSDVDIVAIIHGPSKWHKEVLLKSDSAQDDYFTIRFPLELDEFEDLINDIEKELEIREEQEEYTYEYEYQDGELVEIRRRIEPELNTYDLTIEARVKLGTYTGSGWLDDTFTQAMEISVAPGTLEWDNELNLVQRRLYKGFSYKHVGNFDYTITLKENSLYEPDVETLSPELYEPPTIISRPPGEVYFPAIIDIMKTSFSYHFICDQPVTDLAEEVTVTAVLEHPPPTNFPEEYTEVWRKTFTLVQTTQNSRDFAVDFPIDVNYLLRLAEIIGQEIDLGTGTYNLNIEAEVHTTANTTFGHIDEVFTHTLMGSLDASTLMWDAELQKSEPHTIEGTITVINPNVDKYRIAAPILLVLILFGFIFVLANAIQARVVRSKIEEEAFRAKKKYKNVIVDTRKLPAVKPEETVIACGSLEDLIKISDSLLKPILHQAGVDKHTYCVIDGLTRYEYVSELF